MSKITVIGAGINGVTCAVKIKEKYREFDVVLISKDFTPNTTGDGSGGLWYPYLCGNTPIHLLTKWGGETYNFIHNLWREGGLNVSAMPIYALYRQGHGGPCPAWADAVCGYQTLNEKTLRYLRDLYSVDYVAGHTFTTFVVQPAKIISYLLERFLRAGGRVVTGAVTSLQDPKLVGRVVINCSGLAARDIVPDRAVYPIRGQIFKVKAPWVNATVVDMDSCHYIIPNAETCVLGGTHQDNDFNTHIDGVDTHHILNGCKNLIPGLNQAEIVDSWVGLRPGRDSVRIEAEERNGQLFIHNYGHGGSGLTLFWGCGDEVLSLLERNLHKHQQSIKSKL